MISGRCINKLTAACLFVFVFAAIQADAADELELVNDNPSFEDVPNFNRWDQYVNAPAIAIFEISKDAIEGKQCAYIDVREVTGTNWHVGLTQDGLTIEGGQMYTIDYFAKADAKRIIAIEVKRSPGQGAWEGITGVDINITEEWEEYSHSFTPAKDYDQTAFFGFWLGQVKGEIWIDGLRIYAGQKQEREEILPPKSVSADGKLFSTWSAIKSYQFSVLGN